jgi:hypothetical protein
MALALCGVPEVAGQKRPIPALQRSPQERRVRMELGTGMERYISNATAKEIIDN